MNIYLIRHARQNSLLCNVNVELSKEGIKQAEILGERLRTYDLDILYTSNLLRALETAEIMNKSLSLKIQQYEDLKEISFGDMEGKSDEYIEEFYKDFYDEFHKMEDDMRYPNGENGQDAYNRIITIINKIKKNDYKNVAVVTHGGIIRALICGILGLEQSKRSLLSKSLENTSITTLYYDKIKDRFYLHGFNDYAHLENNKDLLRNRISK